MNIIDTKNLILKEFNSEFTFYENDKYICIILNNKSDIYKIIELIKDNSS